MYVLKFVFFFLFGSIQYAQAQLYDFDCLKPYCFCPSLNVLNCNNFTRFDQLDFTKTNGKVFECVELHAPNSQLDVNELLKFTGLSINGRLIISNIKSFNAFYNPFRQITYNMLSISIFNSVIKFYGNVVNSIDMAILNECKYDQSVRNFNFIFGNLKLVEFSTYYCYFDRPICPLYFQNSKFDYYSVVDPLGAYGFVNVIYSYAMTNSSGILNTNIRQADFSYGVQNLEQPEWFDTQCILNIDLFKDLNRLNINSATRLAYIQEDTFKNLINVKKLEINKVNLKELLTRNRRWVKNLNFNQTVFNFENQRLSSVIMEKIFKLIIWADSWTFNEEKDICLWRNFPHEKLVFPFIINSPTNLPCTCTVYWMYKNLAKYQTIYSLNQNIIPMHCFESNSNWDRCNFGALFNKYCPSSVTDPGKFRIYLKRKLTFIWKDLNILIF